jgi:ornithine cyclodeaminase/alanine dehydrogenase-like protein (mu-crystallin family)
MNPVFFDEQSVRAALRMDQLIPAMARALTDFSAGRSQQPVRSVLTIPGQTAWFGSMPAVCGDVMGAKLVTCYPGNASRNLPTHLAMIQLFRTETGEPLAVLDGRLITEMRTAAVSAVATDLLAPKTAATLAILGSGLQSRAHLEALRLVRSFPEIRIWNRTRQNAEKLAEEFGLTICASAESAVRGADVVLTLTSSPEPILQGTWLGPNTYVNAVGAVGPARRELDTAAMNAFIVVDSRAAAAVESGDLLLAGAHADAELGELRARGSVPNDRRIVFKSLGIAVEDIAAARLVLVAAGLLTA